MYSIYIRKEVDSETILREALLDKYGVKDFEILKNQYGCPYLKDNSDINFSISNKDDYTVCVVSNNNIGVDIERICYLPKVASKFFFKEELDYIDSNKDKAYAFTEIWTKKEAYLKLIGIGLRGIREFNTIKSDFWFEISRENDYLITICMEKKDN